MVCFCIFSGGRRSETRGIVMISFHLWPMVQSWLLQWRGFMHCCSHWIALWGLPCSIQYQGVLGRKGRKHWDACFLFIPNDAGYTWCLLSVFQRMGRFAVVNGNHHGGVVCDWNLYGDPCRLMCHGGGTAKKLFTFQTIQYRGHNADPYCGSSP